MYYKSVSAIAGGGKTAVLLNTFSKGLARCSGSNWVFFPDPNWLCAPGANIKRHLERETLRTGKKLTQRDFVLNLITQALDEADAESATEQDSPAEAPVEARVADETAPADTDTPDEESAV